MKVLMVEHDDERMDLDPDSMNLEATEHHIQLPITVDGLYNLIVCKDCGIGLPLEWVLSHLKDHHGFKTKLSWVLEFLDLEGDTMMVAEAKDWIGSTWAVARAIQNIPVMEGYRYKECQYSTVMIKMLKNHFSKEHRGLKRGEYNENCKVQLVFKARLRK